MCVYFADTGIKELKVPIGKAWVRTLRGSGVAGHGLRFWIFGSDWFLLVQNSFRLVWGAPHAPKIRSEPSHNQAKPILTQNPQSETKAGDPTPT